MAQKLCPECGKPLTTLKAQGFSIEKCICGYQYNLNTGAIEHSDFSKPRCMIVCGKCKGKNWHYYLEEDARNRFCGFCGEPISIPAQKDPNLTITLTCPECQKKSVISAHQGKIRVRCGHCSKLFSYNSGTWPSPAQVPSSPQKPLPQEEKYSEVPCPKCGQSYRMPNDCGDIEWPCAACGTVVYHKGISTEKIANTPQPIMKPNPNPAPAPKPAPTPNPAPAPKPAPLNRYVSILAVGDDLDGCFPITVYLDGVRQGVLANERDEITLHFDENSHRITSSLSSKSSIIPAGRDNYLASFDNRQAIIGIVNDAFANGVQNFVQKIIRNDDIMSVVTKPFNVYQTIEIKCTEDYIVSGYWSKGKGWNEERIYYHEICLTPPSLSRQPTGYWQSLNLLVRGTIEGDDVVNLVYTPHGYTYC